MIVPIHQVFHLNKQTIKQTNNQTNMTHWTPSLALRQVSRTVRGGVFCAGCGRCRRRPHKRQKLASAEKSAPQSQRSWKRQEMWWKHMRHVYHIFILIKYIYIFISHDETFQLILKWYHLAYSWGWPWIKAEASVSVASLVAYFGRCRRHLCNSDSQASLPISCSEWMT